ncbi:MAG: hypothetical protein ACFFCM_04140 [Promethearchaeota archaeon]
MEELKVIDVLGKGELEKLKNKVKLILSNKIYKEITFETIAHKLDIDKHVVQDLVERILISGEIEGEISGDKVVLKISENNLFFLIFWVMIFAIVIVTYNFTIINPLGSFLANFDLWIEGVLIPYTIIGVTYIKTEDVFKTIKMLVVIELMINLVYDWSYIGCSLMMGIRLFADINEVRVPYGFYAYKISYLTYLIISIVLFIIGLITYRYAKKYYHLAIPTTIFALGIVPMIVVFYQNDVLIWVVLFLIQPNLLDFMLNKTITVESIQGLYNYDLLILLSQIMTAIIGTVITFVIYLYEKKKFTLLTKKNNPNSN